jgi:REP element-mobilizing transposase RayT
MLGILAVAYEMPPYGWISAATRSMETRYPNRKYPRLKRKEVYTQSGAVAHVIIGTHQKQSMFLDDALAGVASSMIEELSIEKGNMLFAYCVMPDHIHILVGAAEECSVIKFVKYFKGRFASYCRRNGKGARLQRSFYDHVLRREEDVFEVARYIAGNPVRAGIAPRLGEYPHAGSLVYDL